MLGIAAGRAGGRNDRDGVIVRVRNGVAAAGAGERSLAARGVVVAEGGCFGVLIAVAAGAFVQGASIELSADAPIKPPYIVYMQGGLSWHHAKIGIMTGLQTMKDKGLI